MAWSTFECLEKFEHYPRALGMGLVSQPHGTTSKFSFTFSIKYYCFETCFTVMLHSHFRISAVRTFFFFFFIQEKNLHTYPRRISAGLPVCQPHIFYFYCFITSNKNILNLDGIICPISEKTVSVFLTYVTI